MGTYTIYIQGRADTKEEAEKISEKTKALFSNEELEITASWKEELATNEATN